MIKCVSNKNPSNYIRTIQLVLSMMGESVWENLVKENNPKENKGHLSKDVPSSMFTIVTK